MADAHIPDEQVIPAVVAAKLAAFYRADPQRWTQDWYAHDAKGFDCDATAPEAVCWCLRGAIQVLEPSLIGRDRAVLEEFDRALGVVDPNYESLRIVNWNDNRHRTVNEVIALCDRVAGIGYQFSWFRQQCVLRAA